MKRLLSPTGRRFITLGLLVTILASLHLFVLVSDAWARPCCQTCDSKAPPYDMICWQSCVWCSGGGGICDDDADCWACGICDPGPPPDPCYCCCVAGFCTICYP